MKRNVKGIVICLIVFFMASMASASDTFELEGTISNIDTISNTFVLNTKESGSGPVTVRVMSRIMIDGERKALAAVKNGSVAKGTFKNWNDKIVVVEIAVTAAEQH